MAFRRSLGGFDESPSSVVATEVLTCTLPTVRFQTEMLLCFSVCRSGTATLGGTPSGWTTIINAVGTNVKLAAFYKVVDGSEVAPQITWNGLTTGTSGSPAIAECMCIAGLQKTEIGLIDATGAVSEQAASATAQAGGAGFSTLTNNAVVFIFMGRQDDDAIGLIDPPANGTDGVATWSRLSDDWSQSGLDVGYEVHWGTKATAGAVAAKTMNIPVGSGSSDVSSGVMFALKPGPAIFSPYMSII